MEMATVVSILIAIAGVLYLGIVPGPVMELAKLSVF
jgi:NADH-quinone oxidoreductase subunit N